MGCTESFVWDCTHILIPTWLHNETLLNFWINFSTLEWVVLNPLYVFLKSKTIHIATSSGLAAAGPLARRCGDTWNSFIASISRSVLITDHWSVSSYLYLHLLSTIDAILIDNGMVVTSTYAPITTALLLRHPSPWNLYCQIWLQWSYRHHRPSSSLGNHPFIQQPHMHLLDP